MRWLGITTHALGSVQPAGHGSMPRWDSRTALCSCSPTAAQALNYLHSRSIVHLDVKSSNVRMGGRPCPLGLTVLDWGCTDVARRCEVIS